MAKYKLVIDREECTGCESCVSSCEDSYEMADDGLATLKNSKRVGSNDELEMDALGCSKEGADECPVNCIHIYEGANKIV